MPTGCSLTSSARAAGSTTYIGRCGSSGGLSRWTEPPPTMSRAIRRQQQAAPKGGAAKRPSIGLRAPRPTRGARPPAQPKRRLRISQPRWLEEIVSELKKVSWPTRDETLYLTTVVVIVAVSVGIVLGGIDIFFNWLIDRLLFR